MKCSFPLRHSAQISAIDALDEHLRKKSRYSIHTLWAAIFNFGLTQKFLPTSTPFTETILSLRSDAIFSSLSFLVTQWLAQWASYIRGSMPHLFHTTEEACVSVYVCVQVLNSCSEVLEVTGSSLPVKDRLWWDCNVENTVAFTCLTVEFFLNEN